LNKEGSENDTFLKEIIPQLDKMKARIEEGNKELATPINVELETVKLKK